MTIRMAYRQIVTAASACLTALLTAACSEEHIDDFQNMTGVYFNNRSTAGELQDSADITFVYHDSDEMVVPVKVQLLGRTADRDRAVTITCGSVDATEGVDFVLPDHAVLPAGASSFTYDVVLRRTVALKQRRKSIALEIHANEDFALPVTFEPAANGDSVTTLAYRISFSDRFTQAPSEWEANLLGDFSQQKFELICKVLPSVKPSDFNDASRMTLALQVYIHNEMTAYVAAEKLKRDRGEDYDHDAFDSEGSALTF